MSFWLKRPAPFFDPVQLLANQFKVSGRYCARAGGVVMDEKNTTFALRDPSPTKGIRIWIME